MNNSFARLIEGMCHQLQHEVLPRVTDDYARSQLWGVINALNTFAVRADWSSPLLLQQIAAQQQALTAVATLLPGVGVPASPGDVPSTAGLMALREQGNRAIAGWPTRPPRRRRTLRRRPRHCCAPRCVPRSSWS
jgi:hypothetical protein